MNRSEDLIEKICTKMSFSDFTVPNKKFKMPDGHEKEAADFLVPFRDVLIAFQVKSKEETKMADDKTIVDYGRIQKKVGDLYTKNHSFDNSFGIRVSISPRNQSTWGGSGKTLLGIVTKVFGP